jgi:hypothetical protein
MNSGKRPVSGGERHVLPGRTVQFALLPMPLAGYPAAESGCGLVTVTATGFRLIGHRTHEERDTEEMIETITHPHVLPWLGQRRTAMDLKARRRISGTSWIWRIEASVPRICPKVAGIAEPLPTAVFGLPNTGDWQC